MGVPFFPDHDWPTNEPSPTPPIGGTRDCNIGDN